MPGPGRKFEKGGDPRRNKGGRPRIVSRVRELALEQSEASITTLVDLRDDPAQPGAVRLAAANALLDRAVGKPRQTVEVADMSDEEIQAELRRMVSEAGLAEDDEADASH